MDKKILLSTIAIVLISSVCYAVPLGGKGSDRKESIKGTFEINGTLSVNGKAVLNGQNYVWPKVSPESAGITILKNDGTGNLSWKKEQLPGGLQGSLQYNDAGAFSGSKDLIWDGTNKALYIGNIPVSLTGHTHNASDITQGVLSPALGGTGTNDGSINASQVLSAGTVRTETGFNIKGANGISAVYDAVSDIRLNGTTVQKKIKRITVTGGIITDISADSDWMDAGTLSAPK